VVGCARRRPSDWPDQARFEIADIRDPRRIDQLAQNTWAVVHLAGHAHDESASLDELRASFVHGARTVARAAQATGARLVMVSSTAVYGSAAANIVSSTPVQPDTTYGVAKLESERAALTAHNQTMIVRPTVVYGRYDRGNMSRLVRLVSRIGPIVVGKGDNRKSLVYAPHLAGRIVGLLESSVASGVWCASDRIAPTQAELVALLANAMDRRARTRHIPASIIRGGARVADALFRSKAWTRRVERLTSPSVVDGQELDSLLGFREATTLESALEQAVLWTLGEQPR
jgi:nucleoside-diphosphate-sugar epimerase